MQPEGLSRMKARKFIFGFHIHGDSDEGPDHGQVRYYGRSFPLVLGFHLKY